MQRDRKQSGFTLVELAIVMTIIGLLIGGILKGQELMQNARMTATVAEVKAFRAAVTTFRDEYQQFPGDMRDANNRIRGCTACDSSDGGDGYVGDPDFDQQYKIGTVESTYQGTVQASRTCSGRS